MQSPNGKRYPLYIAQCPSAGKSVVRLITDCPVCRQSLPNLCIPRLWSTTRYRTPAVPAQVSRDLPLVGSPWVPAHLHTVQRMNRLATSRAEVDRVGDATTRHTCTHVPTIGAGCFSGYACINWRRRTVPMATGAVVNRRELYRAMRCSTPPPSSMRSQSRTSIARVRRACNSDTQSAIHTALHPGVRTLGRLRQHQYTATQHTRPQWTSSRAYKATSRR
jgi:hypothetical protein